MARYGNVVVPVAALALVTAAVAGGALWWWAALRLVLAPERAGAAEAVMFAGGWGLSLLPVHVTAFRGRTGSGTGPVGRLGSVWRRPVKREPPCVDSPERAPDLP
jgi:hypothetical protein